MTVGEESEAQQECKKIGGRLPTYEFASLKKNFFDVASKYTNEAGFSLEKFRKVFPEFDKLGTGLTNATNTWETEKYWTSTVQGQSLLPQDMSTGIFFSLGDSGRMVRGVRNSVRCVFDPIMQ